MEEKQQETALMKTIKVEITPIEDDLLTAFRALGSTKGVSAQEIVVELVRTMSEN